MPLEGHLSSPLSAATRATGTPDPEGSTHSPPPHSQSCFSLQTLSQRPLPPGLRVRTWVACCCHGAPEPWSPGPQRRTGAILAAAEPRILLHTGQPPRCQPVTTSP